MTNFRETFEPLLDQAQNPVEPISDEDMSPIQWWFKNYSNEISGNDLLWFIDRICGALGPLKNRMIETVKLRQSNVGANRSTTRTLRTKMKLAEEQTNKLLSLLRFTYNLRLLISCSKPSPNGTDPHDKCADYYDIEDIRNVVEQGQINDLESLEKIYKTCTRQLSTNLRRL